MTKVLLLVDLQPDFMPGGALAVNEGDQLVATANKLIAEGGYDLVFASQDWHPQGHGSFASTHRAELFTMGELAGQPQVMWPDHCVQGTEGAELHPDLNIVAIAYVQKKGQNPEIDSYSAFADNGQNAKTGLDEYLRAKGATEIHVCGLATDYCVKATAIDATKYLPHAKVTFISDASRGVATESTEAALKEMAAAGIDSLTSEQIIADAKSKPHEVADGKPRGPAQSTEVA